MYKIASNKRQTTLHRAQLKDWVSSGNGEQEALTGEELYRQLRQEVIVLEGRIAGSTDLDERKTLGQQKYDAQTKIAALRKSGVGRKRPEIGMVFMNLARTLLPTQQFEMIIKAANREMDRYEREAAEAQRAISPHS